MNVTSVNIHRYDGFVPSTTKPYHHGNLRAALVDAGAELARVSGPDGVVLFKHIAPMTMEVWNKEFLPRIEASRAATGSQS